MTGRFALSCRAAAALVFIASAPGTALADDRDPLAEIEAIRREIDELRRTQATDGRWLGEERAKEIRSIVQDVLADADTRASLQSSGATAGYDNGFFIASPDGNFKLVINGQLQLRYAFSRLSTRSMNQLDPGNYQQPAVGLAEPFVASPVGTTFGNEFKGYQGFYGPLETRGIQRVARGFGVPRAKLEFSGHVVDPSWQFRIVGAFEQQTTQAGFQTVTTAPGLAGFGGTLGVSGSAGGGTYSGNYSGGNGSLGSNFGLEDAYVVKVLDPNWSIKVGQFKAPLLREELVSSKYQLAVERSLTNQFFSEEYTQGIELTFQNDCVRVMGSFNDGGNNANTNGTIGNSSNFGNWTEYALTGRAEWMVSGSWDQFDDFSSPNGTGAGLLIGAAVNWQRGGGDDGNAVGTLSRGSPNGNLMGTGTVTVGAMTVVVDPYLPIVPLQYPNNIPTSANDDVSNLTYTADATLDLGGVSLYGAFIGNIAQNVPAGWVAHPSGYLAPPTDPSLGYEPTNITIIGDVNDISTAILHTQGYGYGHSPIFSYGVVLQAGWFVVDDVELFGRGEYYITLNNSQNAYAGDTPTFWGWVPGGSSPFANTRLANIDMMLNPVPNGQNAPSDSGYSGSSTNPYYAHNLGANPYGAQHNCVLTFGANWFPAGVRNRNVKITGDLSYSVSPVLFGQGIYGRSIAITDFRSDGGQGGGGQWVGRLQLQLLF